MATAKKATWATKFAWGALKGGFGFLSGLIPKKTLWWIFGVISFVIFAFWFAVFNTASTTRNNSSPNWATTTVQIIGAILMVAGAIWLVWRAIGDSKAGTPPVIDWSKVFKNPVLVTAIAVPVVNIFVAMFQTNSWIWFWNHHTLFVGINFGSIIIAHFASKGDKLNKAVAVIIAFVIVSGFFGSIIDDIKLTAPSFGGLGGTSFGRPDLLRLTPEEHKATHGALMKLPLAERKVLWVLYECDPENIEFRPNKKGELPATATYRSKGAEAFGKACVEKLIRARQSFTLAVVEATSEKESDVVVIPRHHSYNVEIEGKNFVWGVNGGPLELGVGDSVSNIREIQVKGIGGPTRIVVILRPKERARDSAGPAPLFLYDFDQTPRTDRRRMARGYRKLEVQAGECHTH